MYQEVFRQFFDLNCSCKAPVARAELATNTNGNLNIHTQVNEEEEPERAHSLRERVDYLQRSLPPLSVLFGEGSYDPTPYFTNWQKFLADQPIEALSFQKTQDSFMKCARKVWRWWDIDSIRFGGNTLAAIRAPNDFRITFLPRYGLNMSTDQVVQPHGLNLAKTRHVLMGYFQAGRVRFSVFVFFPSSASTSYSKTSASSNTLSHERLEELYDEILLPALREGIRGPFCQEVPQSFDMIYAKSRLFQEKPGMGQWSADDESRPFQLSYTLPATRLSQFWSSFEEKADQFKLRTKRGKLVAYFRNPRLVFQAHDLKNSLTGASVDDVLSQFDKTVLSAFNPDHLDMRSCWVDMGVRYCAEGPSGEQRVLSEPGVSGLPAAI